MTIFIMAYNTGSNSARALRNALRQLYPLRLINAATAGAMHFRRGDTIINWGCCGKAKYGNLPVINSPNKLLSFTNKMSFFKMLGPVMGNNLPPYTMNRDVALEWVAAGHAVVARQKLNGHSAEGLVIVDRVEEMVNAPLYTQYIKKRDEYRVHVGKRDGQQHILDVQRKSLRKDHEGPPNYRVRNHDNGFIFSRDNIDVNSKGFLAVCQLTKHAAELCDMDFGAWDVIWNDKLEKAYILEVNSAPGLEGKTLDTYVKFFRDIL